ncbi:MAG: regulatory protein RecX [Candidatus Polarisedimenticolia bacterium]
MGRVPFIRRAPGDPLQEAFGYLARRSRTVAETRRHLARRGHLSEAAEQAIERLQQMGYLDDLAYTRRYAGWSASEKPMGRSRLVAELAAHGVDRDTIARGLDDCFGDEDERHALERALERALRGQRGALDAQTARRLAARLMRRGFGAGRVHAALKGLGAADETESD